MPMQNKDVERYSDIHKRYNIKIHPILESAEWNASWPTEYKAIFDRVTSLGEENYSTAQNQWIGAGSKRQRIFGEVEKLCNKVRSCRDRRASEQDWLTSTHFVLDRFDDRILVDDEIYPMFSERADEIYQYYEDVVKDINRKLAPDGVYGLNTTPNMEELLNLPFVGEPSDLLNAKIKYTPFVKGTEVLSFPFLVHEAKSEKGQDPFSSMEMKASLPVYDALRMQDELSTDTPASSRLMPLVWFLANKGEEWRVYACFISKHNGKPRYNILPLWQGNVIGRSDALRLLLIAEHIHQWARDVYLPAILKQLQVLTSPRAEVLTGDENPRGAAPSGIAERATTRNNVELHLERRLPVFNPWRMLSKVILWFRRRLPLELN